MAEPKRRRERVRFGDVVRLVRESCKDPIAAGIERVIGLEHLEPGDLRVGSWATMAEGTTFTNRVRPGQVLFGKRRAYQRKVAVAEFDAVCSGDLYVFEGMDAARLLPELLPFLLQTDAFFNHAVGTSAGSLSPRTNWSSLAEFEFTLPSLEEQRRALKLLTGITNVVNTFRDEISRASEAASHIRDRATLHGESSRSRVHEGWANSRIGDVVDFIGGSQPPASTFQYERSESNVRLIQIRDYKGDDYVTYIPRDRVKKSCSHDDVMIGRYGPPVFQILRGLSGAYNVALIKAVPRAGLMKAYLFHYLRGKRLHRLIDGLSRRSSGQSGVDMEKLREFPILIPSVIEQARLSALFDELDGAIASQQKRLVQARELLRLRTETLLGRGD